MKTEETRRDDIMVVNGTDNPTSPPSLADPVLDVPSSLNSVQRTDMRYLADSNTSLAPLGKLIGTGEGREKAGYRIRG